MTSSTIFYMWYINKCSVAGMHNQDRIKCPRMHTNSRWKRYFQPFSNLFWFCISDILFCPGNTYKISSLHLLYWNYRTNATQSRQRHQQSHTRVTTTHHSNINKSLLNIKCYTIFLMKLDRQLWPVPCDSE